MNRRTRALKGKNVASFFRDGVRTLFVYGLIISALLAACSSPTKTPSAIALTPNEDATPLGKEGDTATTTVPAYRVFSNNRRGMSFPDQDFSVFAIFPPANFLRAQIVRPSLTLEKMPELLGENDVEVRYSAVIDNDGSINTTSVGKTNYWTNVNPLYNFMLPSGTSILPDEGLHGSAYPGQSMPSGSNTPQRFTRFDPLDKTFLAPWIPILPIDDSGHRNNFPLFQVDVVKPGTLAVLGKSVTVLPIAEPMNCAGCHATDGVAATEQMRTLYKIDQWSTNPVLANQGKENVLKLHVAKNGALANTAGPLMCASCHYSPVHDPDGRGPIGSHQIRRNHFSISMHAAHGLSREQTLPTATNPANIPETGSSTCTACHGGNLPYFRDTMAAVGLVCQDCHGGLLAVARSPLVGAPDTRTPFAQEPRCESCHTGDAVTHLGDALVLRMAYDTTDLYATPRLATNRRFAEEPGKLYRQSSGHGGIACMSCHGSPHALWPVKVAGTHDNLIATQLQGHAGVIIECTTCHAGGVRLSLEGPHGLHNVNDANWIAGHGPFFNRDSPTRCQACHGTKLEGSYLSRVTVARHFTLPSGKSIAYAEGQQVGCGDCHTQP